MFVKNKKKTKVEETKEVSEEKFKRRSTSSMFSKRDCRAHECVTHSERMTKVLVRHCSMVLKHNHFSYLWLDALDAVIEKGKGNMMSK